MSPVFKVLTQFIWLISLICWVVSLVNHCHVPRSVLANRQKLPGYPIVREETHFMRGPVRDQPCPIDGHQHCVWSLSSCKSPRLISTCAWLLLPWLLVRLVAIICTAWCSWCWISASLQSSCGIVDAAGW